MAIEKKERELKLKRRQRQLDMEMEIEAVQAETYIADLRDQTTLRMQEMKLQIGEAEGSFLGSTVCPCLMSLTNDKDTDSSIKNWLNQNSDVTDIQEEKSQVGVITGNGETAITSDAMASRSRGQPLIVLEKKERSSYLTQGHTVE